MTRATHRLSRLASASALALALATPIGFSPIFATPAQAFLFGGGGRIVYDPRNHAENILSAARALEQINNQITQLQNEAQMLMNQARNLASPALLFAAGIAAECRPDPTASVPGAEHRLRRRPDRPGLPAGLCQYPHGRARGAASGRCALPLGKHRRRAAGCAPRAGGCRRQSRRSARRALRACRRKPIRPRCPAGDPGGQTSSWRCNPSRSPT